MKTSLYHTALLFILSVLISCSVNGYLAEDVPEREIVSHDNLCSIRVPLSWVQVYANERAAIQAVDLGMQYCAAVFTENKFGFWQFMDLDLKGFFAMKSWYLIDSLSEVSLGKQKELTIHGKRAIMIEVTGVRNNERISYLYTAVEGYLHFHEIVLWTQADRYKQARPLFLRMVRSFEEHP